MKEPDESYANGHWWLYALLFPVGCAMAGFLLVFVVSQQQDDWLGLRFFLPLIFAVPIGAIGSCIAAVVSIVRRERHSEFGALAGFLCLLF